jgi:multicomponent Na+:H+ antiporter subunit C
MAFIRCFGKGKLDKMTLFTNYYETAAVILFGIGLTTLLLHKNMIKKIMGFNIMDTAIYLFLTSKGYIVGRLAPIVVNDDLRVETYVNPIPSGLVLTGIVVSVSVTALMLAITVRLYKRYGTLDIDEIALSAKREEI